MHTRSLKLERAEAGPIPCVLATTTPVTRSDGYGETYDEVLTCTPDAVDLTRAPLPVLISHNANDLPVGQIVNLRADGRALRGDLILGQSTRAKELEPDLRSGLISSLSVGYAITKHTRKGDTFTATRWQPHEVSLVAIPADPQSGTYRSKSTMTTEIEDDTDTNRLTRSQRRAQREQEEAEREETASEERAERLAETRELRRIGEITELCLKHDMTDLLPQLTVRGITTQVARNRILDAMAERSSQFQTNPYIESNAPVIRVQTGGYLHGSVRDVTDVTQMAEAAVDGLLIRAGIVVPKPHKDAREFAGMTAVQIGTRLMGRHGVTVRDPSQLLARTQTTSNFPYLLANVANKALQMGFENEPASHRAWVRNVDVSDFKTQTRVQRSEAPGLLEVAEAAEYTYGTFGERQEQYAIASYGRIFAITRQALVNDDLAAFTTLPQAFGAAAARLEADKVYAVLTANAAMADTVALFHSTHGNLAVSGTELDLTSLGAARTAMRKQMGQGGLGYLNVIPRFLIVPAALETRAEVLVASTVKVGGSNAEPNAEFIRNLIVVVDPRLDTASATAWYLAASPTQVDTVETAYLAGQRGVFTETENAFETDGMKMKARLDFGVKAIDWKGLYKNAGA